MTKDIDFGNTKTISDYRRIWLNNFTIGYLSNNINEKFALISLICYITQYFKSQHKYCSHYDVLKKLAEDKISDDILCRLGIICEEFGYGCTEFPTFDIPQNKMVGKAKELLFKLIPF